MRIFTRINKPCQAPAPLSSRLARPSTTTEGGLHRGDTILPSQQAIAVSTAQRILKPDADEQDAHGRAQASPRFGLDFGKISVYAPMAGTVQTKLTLNDPGDEYEREAERVAKQVMRMPASPKKQACSCGATCPKCQTNSQGQEYVHLQAMPAGLGHAGQTAAPPIVGEALASPGQALDNATRAFFEPRFGHSFANVRIHAGPQANAAARAINADAFTVGADIVFANGARKPEIMAHELAHVIQQQPRIVQRVSLYGAGGNAHPCPSVATTPPADFCKKFATKDEALEDRDGVRFTDRGAFSSFMPSQGHMVLGLIAAYSGFSAPCLRIFSQVHLRRLIIDRRRFRGRARV